MSIQLQLAQIDAALGWFEAHFKKAQIHPGQIALFKNSLCQSLKADASSFPCLASLDHTPRGMIRMALAAAEIPADALPHGMEMLLRKDGSVAVKTGPRGTYQEIYAPQKAGGRVLGFLKGLTS